MYNAWGSSQPSNSDSSQHWLTAVLNESYEGKWNDADVETSTDYESSLTRKNSMSILILLSLVEDRQRMTPQLIL